MFLDPFFMQCVGSTIAANKLFTEHRLNLDNRGFFIVIEIIVRQADRLSGVLFQNAISYNSSLKYEIAILLKCTACRLYQQVSDFLKCVYEIEIPHERFRNDPFGQSKSHSIHNTVLSVLSVFLLTRDSSPLPSGKC